MLPSVQADAKGGDMGKVRMVLVIAAIAASSIVVAAPPASACAGNKVCETINGVCYTVLHRYCLR
jgi:hypothetical protein